MAELHPSNEFLTVRELADLLRIKERKVYDLAASGKVPCSRVTGKLLFPEVEVRAWIDNKKIGSERRVRSPEVFLGSHDPLLEWALRESQSGFATLLDSSLDGLGRFDMGEGSAAGLHISEEGGWNLGSVKRALPEADAVLIRWATRRRGLVLGRSVAAHVATLADIAGMRIARRQHKAGAELLFRNLLIKAEIAEDKLGSSYHFRSEQDAVLAVAQGDADVAFGLEAVSSPYGLDFVPLADEQFDIVVDRRSWFEAPMQTLFAFAEGDRFRNHAEKLGGYDIAELGSVVWNAP